MSEPKTTIRKILDDLNGEGNDTPWEEMDNIYATRQVSIDKDKNIRNINRGVVLKMFVHNETGQIKLYLAKDTDDPEARKLL